jgi:hypothetical protein
VSAMHVAFAFRQAAPLDFAKAIYPHGLAAEA